MKHVRSTGNFNIMKDKKNKRSKKPYAKAPQATWMLPTKMCGGMPDRVIHAKDLRRKAT